jgi:hypothetical protein
LTAPIDRDLILTANFKYVQQTYTLTTNVFPSGCGYVSRSPYKETYAAGEEVDLRATPYSGYAFSGWSGVPNGLRPITVIRMNEDKTVTANFYRKSVMTPTSEGHTTWNSGNTTSYNYPSKQTGRRGLYFAPKYQTPVGTPLRYGGGNLEWGLIWGNGVFLGVDLNLGSSGNDSDEDCFLVGGGLSLGHTLNFSDNLHFIYGGSIGLWFLEEDFSDYSKISISYLAPFIKLRWKFIELTYRGLLGQKFVHMEDNYDLPFGLYSHQLMIGLYLAE